MKMKIYLFIMVLCVNIAHANDLPEPFNGLKFLYVASGCVVYDENISEVINKESVDEESGIEITRTIKTKIDRKEDTDYIVDFDEGFSVDPGFTIYKQENEKLFEIKKINGTEIIIPGNGYIYVSGHTNNMFNKRRMFKISGASLYEIKQPYYYVGAESKANVDITLYASQEMKTEVVKISKGTKITVLVNRDKDYLIKTPFGLTGWYRMEHEYPVGLEDKSALEGIFFNGD